MSLHVFSPIIGGKKTWALWIFQAQVRVDTLTRPHEARVKKTWRVWGKKAMAFAVNFPLNPPIAMNGKSWVLLKVQSSLIFIGARYLVAMNGGRYPPIPLVSHPCGLKSDPIFLAESHIVHRCNPAPSVLSIGTFRFINRHQVVIRWTHPESYNIPVVHYKAGWEVPARSHQGVF